MPELEALRSAFDKAAGAWAAGRGPGDEPLRDAVLKAAGEYDAALQPALREHRRVEGLVFAASHPAERS